MPFVIKTLEKTHLEPLKKCNTQDVIALCKVAFDYLSNGPIPQESFYKALSEKYNSQIHPHEVQQIVEALISILIEATKSKTDINGVKEPLMKLEGFNEEITDVLAQFVTSKKKFVEGSIKSANIRAYRLVNVEWRLEVRLASRALMKQSQIFVTMKLYLHTEPKNENRDLLDDTPGKPADIHDDERRNRKDLLVQTDISSLKHMIQSLEEALMESRSRRIRNIVAAIH
ncbi:COMM domain-containing protein 2 [Haematobia irritans]|uniref:COMM domain-containing protein 2 n=1 Tax=Haematobia irritans TaxID=7368 RepID=UPI003F4F4E9E